MKLVKNGARTEDYRYDRTLDDGTYAGVVLDAREDISRNGNQMIVVLFGFDGPLGRVKVDHRVVTHVSRFTEELLAALAPELLAQWEDEGACELRVEDLVRRSCQVRIENKTWNGRARPEIRALVPAVVF